MFADSWSRSVFVHSGYDERLVVAACPTRRTNRTFVVWVAICGCCSVRAKPFGAEEKAGEGLVASLMRQREGLTRFAQYGTPMSSTTPAKHEVAKMKHGGACRQIGLLHEVLNGSALR